MYGFFKLCALPKLFVTQQHIKFSFFFFIWQFLTDHAHHVVHAAVPAVFQETDVADRTPVIAIRCKITNISEIEFPEKKKKFA